MTNPAHVVEQEHESAWRMQAWPWVLLCFLVLLEQPAQCVESANLSRAPVRAFLAARLLEQVATGGGKGRGEPRCRVIVL